MKNLRRFLSEHKHFYLLILLLPVLIWFKYLEMTLIPKYIIHTTLDDHIPFVKEFVVPYLLWFPYIAYGVLYTGVHSREDFCKLIIFLGGGMSVAYLVCMIFPNAQDLRPSITQNDPFSVLVKLIYATDTPTNVCPSVHVINAIAVNAALQHSGAFAVKKYRKPCSHTLTILICLSTVFIKQHSIVDVGWGIFAAALFYLWLYVFPNRKNKNGPLHNRKPHSVQIKE
ncbi:hypothetical protein SAMN02745823_01316 [Sporobacter termitidis DSM 10068]|uniref:PAP2 superfamily protein n=1 Tax=Sporobacter termitidis DSM 10068 TaxID=1123282 RepID=A0A1M5WJS0_9FIRM|nr:phosphatase PAP2 family protein [Sporobacter termitidis]SHH87711.1 hypothetical protein SAMN02745823_01316 [Sporobacter termitidis DSM 10068]